MFTRITICAHAYAEDEIHDEYFESDDFGIVGPEVMLPLCKVRGNVVEYQYNETSELINLDEWLSEYIWGNECDIGRMSSLFCFLSLDDRFYIEDPHANLSFIINKYLDPLGTGNIKVCYLVSYNAGAVGPKNGPLRYRMHSREHGKHNQPHVHVRTADFEFDASIAIEDGEVLAGELPAKLLREARKEILSRKEYYYKCWNTLTDGLSVDVDYRLGRVGY